MSEPVAVIEHVTKTFDSVRAVDDISFVIEPGTIYGLLGPNGAGKTTTIRMMMRIIYPDSGRVTILGEPLARVNKDHIGYLPEERGVYRKMRVIDLLTFFGEIKSMNPRVARQAAGEWLERLSLGDTALKKVEELSKGMQQKVQFIATILHAPPLIILDEPFSGLDPVNVNVLKDIILEFHRKGHTVIFSTHVMEQVEKLCRRICLINKGKVILEGALAEVKHRFGRNVVTLHFEGDGAFLKELPGVEGASDYGSELSLRLREGTDPSHILQAAAARLKIQKFEVSEPSIHDIFVDLVSEAAHP
jgi:ABC-2 type transport system ATP-binding protein